MSIGMFFVSPQTPEERAFYLPVCTEDVFLRVLLPAAEKVGTHYVPLFASGYELSAEDAFAVSGELLSVAKQLEVCSSEVSLSVSPRLRTLQIEIKRIFETNPRSTLYIG